MNRRFSSLLHPPTALGAALIAVLACPAVFPVQAAAENGSALVAVSVELGASSENVYFLLAGRKESPRISLEGDDLVVEIAGAHNRVHDVVQPANLKLLRRVRVSEERLGSQRVVLTRLSLAPSVVHRLERSTDGFRIVLLPGEPVVDLSAAAPPEAPPPAPQPTILGVAVSLEESQESEEATPAPLPAPRLEAPPLIVQPGDYVIGRQDLLQISVFQLDSLSQTVRVQEDGTISLPLVGELRVEGMTRRELEKSIAARLTPRYLLDPQVSVFVKEFQSKKVAVLGAVGRPGSFELIGTRTLLEMLSLAEGILKEQAGATIQIHRKGPNGQTHVIPIDFAALEGGVPTANVVVQGGDIIHVPVDDLLLIYVNGAVRRPDVFKVKRSEPLTVLRAVTMAGGINERGSERRVQVVRQQPDGTARVIPVDLKRIKKGKDPDIALEKNDVVVVPEAFF